jgi:alkylation response protein AidB-like acyl-CoA dehydrogenase
MEEYEIARMWRDARVQRIYGGTTEIMKEIISRQLDLGGPPMSRPAVASHSIYQTTKR